MQKYNGTNKKVKKNKLKIIKIKTVEKTLENFIYSLGKHLSETIIQILHLFKS